MGAGSERLVGTPRGGRGGVRPSQSPITEDLLAESSRPQRGRTHCLGSGSGGPTPWELEGGGNNSPSEISASRESAAVL